MGYVYLFLEVDKEGNEAYKIGMTKNEPINRVKQLQTFHKLQIFINKNKNELYLRIERPYN